MAKRPHWIHQEALTLRKEDFLSENQFVDKIEGIEKCISEASDFDQDVIRIIVQFLACAVMPGNFQHKKRNEIKLKILDNGQVIVDGDDFYPTPEFGPKFRMGYNFYGYTRTDDAIFVAYPSVRYRQTLTLQFTERNFPIEVETRRKHRGRRDFVVNKANPDLSLVKGDKLISFAGIKIGKKMSSARFEKMWNNTDIQLPISIEFERVISMIPEEIYLKGHQNFYVREETTSGIDLSRPVEYRVLMPFRPWKWERVDA